VQTGDDHALEKVSPLFLILSRCGVVGLRLPILYPFNASTPRSSAMINKIFGD
jgi:hypothetical protein